MKKTKTIRGISAILLTALCFFSSCAVKSSSPAAAGRYTMMESGRAQDYDASAGVGILPKDRSEEFNTDTDEFDHIVDNPFLRVKDNPLSTFSIDVDTAGYSIVRYFIKNGSLPPKSSVRIEELINYFDYNYTPPNDGRPFAVHAETGECPWNREHLLARIAVKGKEFPVAERPKVNLVFLLDVSGSMDEPNKLPLVKSAMNMLVNELNGSDRIAVCVYAGAAGTVLEPTSCDNKNRILNALNRLSAGGSTAGGAGIQLAYNLAEKNFDPAGINRVILCTDGDFNVGLSNRGGLTDLIEEKAKTGVYLTVLGFGMGNYKDGTLKQLAAKGNGNYGYIDTIEEARKMLVKQIAGTLITIANDVKIQVEFNPATVGAYPSYRLRKPYHALRGIQRRHG
jgi:Ca-activated chloride channel family protein